MSGSRLQLQKTCCYHRPRLESQLAAASSPGQTGDVFSTTSYGCCSEAIVSLLRAEAFWSQEQCSLSWSSALRSPVRSCGSEGRVLHHHTSLENRKGCFVS